MKHTLLAANTQHYSYSLCVCVCVSMYTYSVKLILFKDFLMSKDRRSNRLTQLGILVPSPSGGNVTVIRATFDWVPSASQLGDHFLCAVAVNSRDVYSAPLCAHFRVFGMSVQVSGPQKIHCCIHTYVCVTSI